MEKGAATRLLILVVAAHLLVDTVASVINPLWPTLKAQTGCDGWGFFALYLMWNVVNSCTQMLFGLVGERFGGRWMIWAGPTVAILSLSLLGYVSSPWTLGILTMLAGMGIAAFHPEAATTAGNSLPGHRSRAMSLFQIGGYLGQTAGPYYSGQVVANAGTPGLMPGMLWMLVVVAALRWGMREPETEERLEKKAVIPWRDIFRGRITALFIILGVGVLRIIPAAGIPLALAFLETSRQSTTADIGLVQSAFTFGIGGGGLMCALFVRPKHESWLLWLLPLFSAPLMLAIPVATSIWLLACSAATGVLLGTTFPILIGRGQQLMPNSPRVGSSITMGLSWGIGGGLAGLILMLFQKYGRLEQAFLVFAVAAVMSSGMCFLLTKPMEEKKSRAN